MAQQLGVATPVAIVLAVVGVVLVFGLQAFIAARGIAAAVAEYQPKFPPPEPMTEAAAEGVGRTPPV